MKLYFSPGACSLSPHIALCEAGLDHTLEQVDLATKKTRAGADYLQVNPKGYVPALVLDDGQVLTEGPAVVQYIADLAPDSGLAPPAGTFARYRLQEWLSFISTELHKSYSPLFNKSAAPEWKQAARDSLARRYDLVARGALATSPWLMGERFTVADGYLFTVLRWSRLVGVDLGPWPVFEGYLARATDRPAVQAAMRAEGLIKTE